MQKLIPELTEKKIKISRVYSVIVDDDFCYYKSLLEKHDLCDATSEGSQRNRYEVLHAHLIEDLKRLEEDEENISFQGIDVFNRLKRDRQPG